MLMTDRTLSVLRAPNEHNGSSVSELSTATSISRPALYRILDSLCVQGYVRRRRDGERYELTPLVRSLSDGFKDEGFLIEVSLNATTRWLKGAGKCPMLAGCYRNLADAASV